MKTITVELCMGTTCFVMGSSALPDFLDSLSPEQRSAVVVKHSPCMGLCKDQKYGKAPYARVDGEVISSANALKLAEAIRKHCKA